MFSLTTTKKISLIILLLCTLLAVYASFQFELRTQTVGKIISETNLQTEKQVDEHGNSDETTQQQLNLLILNHDLKGKMVTIQNSYSTSQVKDHKYHKNEYVFLQVESKNEELSGHIIELKRDHYLILLTSLLLLILILMSDLSGLLTFFSFLVNGLLLSGIFLWYQKINSHLLVLLFLITIPILVTLTLTIANGWNKKTQLAIFTTLIGSLLTFLIGFVVITLLSHKGLHYEEMELVTRPPQILFLSSLLIGCIGAVMDVAITIISSLFELIETKHMITSSELKKAGTQIGEDIMGPMINIMFFSYLSGAIPLVLIFLKNQMSFNYTFSIVLSLEIARALVGSIGIILAIPLTIHFTLFVFKRGKLNEC
ncbi:MAG: YibE/F family protein [Vagococcus sp.]|uniref:YibE/F family protein n=1 Tax=Vagococcus sp. TaxID=1933889 RepID=UPI002FCC49BD